MLVTAAQKLPVCCSPVREPPGRRGRTARPAVTAATNRPPATVSRWQAACPPAPLASWRGRRARTDPADHEVGTRSGPPGGAVPIGAQREAGSPIMGDGSAERPEPDGPPGEHELRHLITRQLASRCGVPSSELQRARALREPGLATG